MTLTPAQLKKIPKLPNGKPDMRSKAARALRAVPVPAAPDPVIGGTGRLGVYAPIDLNPKTESILQEAEGLINGDRERDYGHPKKNLNDISAFWSTYLVAKHGIPVTLSATDVCNLMTLLKIARGVNGPFKRDTIVDSAAYQGLIGRLHDET